MAADIEAARWLVYHGAWCVDRGTPTSDLAAKVKPVASETAACASAAMVPAAPASCASTRSAASTATPSST
ncbi:MAG: hypothetical protein U1E86_20460 [Burkholderiaceae bacterium]